MELEHTLVLVDRKTEQQKNREYLKLNPTGRIPTLVDGDQVIFESAAIAMHLCEQHPEHQLIPEMGSSERAEFFQWLFYLTTSIQSGLMLYFYPDKHTLAQGNYADISNAQEQRVTEMFALLDQELSSKKFLLGDHLSLCDFFVFMLSYWASGFSTPPLSFQHLGRYLRDLASRPSVKSVCEIEGTSLEAYQ
jgi:glutathione S-transferase